MVRIFVILAAMSIASQAFAAKVKSVNVKMRVIVAELDVKEAIQVRTGMKIGIRFRQGGNMWQATVQKVEGKVATIVTKGPVDKLTKGLGFRIFNQGKPISKPIAAPKPPPKASGPIPDPVIGKVLRVVPAKKTVVIGFPPNHIHYFAQHTAGKGYSATVMGSSSPFVLVLVKKFPNRLVFSADKKGLDYLGVGAKVNFPTGSSKKTDADDEGEEMDAMAGESVALVPDENLGLTSPFRFLHQSRSHADVSFYQIQSTSKVTVGEADPVETTASASHIRVDANYLFPSDYGAVGFSYNSLPITIADSDTQTTATACKRPPRR